MTVGKPQRSDIVDRKEQVARLVDNLSDPAKELNYALIGQRRIGKTTILQKAKEELQKKGVITVYVDLSIYKFSPYDLTQNIMSQITNAYAKDIGKLEKAQVALSGLLRTITKLKKLSISLEPSVSETGQFSIQIRPEVKETEDYRSIFTLAFDYANEISGKSGKRIVIMIDEFPSIIEFKRFPKLEAVMEIFRSVLENRENVEYVVSGSRVHFMKQVLGDGKSPLFGHFVILEIDQLAEKYANELFMKTAKCTKEQAKTAYGLVGGQPYYLIMLAENCRPKENLNDAYERILTSSSGPLNLYVNYILKEDLGSSTKEARLMRILKAISEGKTAVSEISKQINLKLTSLPFYLQELDKYDLIRRSDGGYTITDKVVNDYFRAKQE